MPRIYDLGKLDKHGWSVCHFEFSRCITTNYVPNPCVKKNEYSWFYSDCWQVQHYFSTIEELKESIIENLEKQRKLATDFKDAITIIPEAPQHGEYIDVEKSLVNIYNHLGTYFVRCVSIHGAWSDIFKSDDWNKAFLFGLSQVELIKDNQNE